MHPKIYKCVWSVRHEHSIGGTRMGRWTEKSSVPPAVSISPHHSQAQCSFVQHPEVDFSPKAELNYFLQF